MKKWSLLLPPVVLGLVGAALRLAQVRLVIDPDTGLARSHPLSILLPLYLLAVAVLFLLRAWPCRGKNLRMDQLFQPPTQELLPVFVCAALLYVVSGAGLVVTSTGGGTALPLLLGAFSAGAGLALLVATALWRRNTDIGVFLLVPMLFALVWLLVTYNRYAAWPVTAAFYLQVLSIAAAACAFYQLAAFGYGQGNRRMFRWLAPLASALCISALGDSLVVLPVRGMYLASAAALLCFLYSEQEADLPAPGQGGKRVAPRSPEH